MRTLVRTRGLRAVVVGGKVQPKPDILDPVKKAVGFERPSWNPAWNPKRPRGGLYDMFAGFISSEAWEVFKDRIYQLVLYGMVLLCLYLTIPTLFSLRRRNARKVQAKQLADELACLDENEMVYNIFMSERRAATQGMTSIAYKGGASTSGCPIKLPLANSN